MLLRKYVLIYWLSEVIDVDLWISSYYVSYIMKYFLTVFIILVMFVHYNHGCVRRRKENMRAPVIPAAVAVANLKSGRQRKGLRCWWNNATGYQCIDIDPRRRITRRSWTLPQWSQKRKFGVLQYLHFLHSFQSKF